MNTWVIVIVIAIVLLFWIIAIYNRLIAEIEAINNNQKQIDVQLDRRYKVFESLLNVVKNYMDYEKTTLKDVVALRNQAQQAGSSQERIAAENGISKIAANLNLVFEQYPELKANTNAMQLQEEISNTENKLAYAKQAFNDSIERYNADKKSFLQAMVVNLFAGKLNKDFNYWGLSADKIAEQENYTVKM